MTESLLPPGESEGISNRSGGADGTFKTVGDNVRFVDGGEISATPPKNVVED